MLMASALFVEPVAIGKLINKIHMNNCNMYIPYGLRENRGIIVNKLYPQTP